MYSAEPSLLNRGQAEPSAEDVEGSETTQYDAIMMVTGHYTSVQIHRAYSAKCKSGRKLQTLGDDDGSASAHRL